MKTAIVILNWNGRKMMERFLPTVLKYSRNDAEVWVADNASTDGSMEMLAQKFPEVKTLVLDRNYGFADGYNRALQQIEADYYVLLNSDVEVTHHWLTPLQEYMDTHDDVAACQPKLLSEADKSTASAIRCAAAVSSTPWSATTDNMTIRWMCCGLRVPV